MKKLFALFSAVLLCAALLAGCGGSASSASTEPTVADPEKVAAIVAAIEAVNPVENPRAYDDFSVENELMMTMDNLLAYQGDVTNNAPADSALVFVAQAKDGAVEDVQAELQAHKDTLAAGTLYAEFADATAKAKDAILKTSGNYVILVVAGVNGPDYADIDAAIDAALAE